MVKTGQTMTNFCGGLITLATRKKVYKKGRWRFKVVKRQSMVVDVAHIVTVFHSKSHEIFRFHSSSDTCRRPSQRKNPFQN